MKRKRHTTQYPGVRYRLVNEDRPDGPRRYIVDYSDANGVPHTETLPVGTTLEAARARKAELENRKRTYVPTNMTVGELLDEWVTTRDDLRPNTLEAHRHGITALKKHLQHRKVKDLTPNDVARFIAAQKKDGLKSATINRQLSPLGGALKVAVREGWIPSNPMDLLLTHERPKSDRRKMRCLERDEIARLLKGAQSERDRVLFSLLVFTGLRISEALALTWEDIDFREKVIHVRDSKTEAGVRDVMLIQALVEPLARLHLAQPRGTENLFITRTHRPLQRRQALKALNKAEDAAGLDHYTLHELRHTFASILIAQGELPTLVAHQMGHADPGVTMKVYAHLFEAQENIERARERLQQAFGGLGS